MQPDEEHHLYLKHWLLINYISKTTGGKIKGITIKYQISFIYFGNISKDQMPSVFIFRISFYFRLFTEQELSMNLRNRIVFFAIIQNTKFHKKVLKY